MTNQAKLHEAVMGEVKHPFATKIKEEYLSLVAQKKELESRLDELKGLAIESCQELLTARKTTTFTQKADARKLPIEFYSLSNAKINATYTSALGGDKFLKKYGLKMKEAISYSWKSSLGKGDN